MNRFYMLYVEGKNSPAKKHFSIEEARIEAERLARKEKKPVYVLLTREMCEIAEAPVLWQYTP